MKDKSLHKHQSTVLIVGGEHSQFKKAMKDYICDNDKNKPMVLESHDKELLSKFIKYFDEKSDYDIIHNDEYGEYQPSRYSLKDIYENFLESQRTANLTIDEYETQYEYQHQESSNEDYFECEAEYLNGNWC